MPEFLRRDPAFEPRYVSKTNSRYWTPSHPYHVALYDPYIRENYDMIVGCCSMNKIPYEPTGECISHGGGTWHTCRFAKQLHAIQFWDAFQGQWMLGDSFHYPEKPKDLPRRGLEGPFGAFI